MKKITEVRWHGRGGQGAKTAALLLAGAALDEGKYIQGFPEYGPERMGAPMQSFTRISESPITVHSHVSSPDAVVVLDSTLLEMVNVTEGLSDEGVILVNTSQSPQQIREKLGLKKAKVFTVDATSISLETMGRNLPNTPMLGALIKATSLLKVDTVISNIEKKLGKKYNRKVVEGNIRAIKRAYEEVKGE
ncbi:pyruvate synthase [Candidatus Aerophobetes bacterium]|uniref:Pyruvate synthase n=1 Tax=Aerophobetes bacterium TaxID=2030807 RepID=A0A497E3Z1_UNCAE|nr:MAG: pyruvate synthase [Candidatus Aerophobetes bacterium]